MSAAAIIFSCNQSMSSQTDNLKAPVDSLISNLLTSFNRHDSTGIRNLFLADALLIDDNLVTKNLEELSNEWIHPNIRVVNNFKSTKLQYWSTRDRAGYAGNWTLEVVVKDSVNARPTGAITVNWMKTDKGDWKINTAHFHNLTEHK
jgi:ketosteroid isomerase-like protein